MTVEKNGLFTKQTKSILILKTNKCLSKVIVNDITKLVKLFVIHNNLPYLSLGLHHFHEFQLNIYLTNYIILQNNTMLPLLSNISKKDISRTLFGFKRK